MQTDCSVADLAFSRVLILMDPDVDGTHTRILLLRLFEHYLSPLIVANKVSIILPPLFRVQTRQSNTVDYAWDVAGRVALLADMPQADIPRELKALRNFPRQNAISYCLSLPRVNRST